MPEERKLVSILFADVTGSTQLGEDLDPEDVRALMSRYYEHAQAVIASYGGTLEKFIGDAVMAIFGLPRALGDDAERAVAAALALRSAVVKDELLGPSFLLRMGINTGEVIATSDAASGVFLATGDTVNVAARLQQSAHPGEIVVGERTRNATIHAFTFGEIRQVEVRGKREPLRVCVVEASRPTRTVEHPPMVGRKQDLLQLSLLQARALEESRPQLASIIAPAGTGKTRLLEEFLRRLDPEDGFRIATARCVPYGQNVSYWPLRGLLRELLGEEICKTAVREVFTRGGQNERCAQTYAQRILATLGIEGEKAGDRENIFIAWRLLIEILAQEAPRIIVFEDLHWASDSLLDLVEHIIQTRTQAQLMLVALSRPELLDRRPTWGGGKANFSAIALQPLSAVQTRDFVTRLMGDITPDLKAQIVERSGGNPFFVLELLRGLRERGGTESIVSLTPLPDTVHAAVLARIDQLSALERSVLQVASVASRAFTFTTLYDVLDEVACTLIDEAVNGLIDRELIAPNAHAFVFRHILIRDVAYSTLSRSARVRLHEQIACSLEQAERERIDEYVELIAYHYREAVVLSRQSAVRAPVKIDCERAISYFRRAAVLASNGGAFAEAYAYLQSAIDIASEGELMALYELLGDSNWWSDTTFVHYQKALDYWEKLYQQEQDSREIAIIGARLLRKVILFYTRAGGRERLAEGIMNVTELYGRGMALAEAAGDEYEQWRLRVALLFHYEDQSVPMAERLRVGEEAVLYFEQRQDWHAMSEALDICSVVACLQGDVAQMLAFTERRLALPDLPAVEYGDAFTTRVRAYMQRHEPERAIKLVQQELQKLRGQSLLHISSAITWAMGAAYSSGQWETVIALKAGLDEVLEQGTYDPGTLVLLLNGYFPVLQVAIAREDQATIEQTVNVLRRLATYVPVLQEGLKRIIELYLCGIARFEEDFILACDQQTAALAIQHYNDYGLPVPAVLIERIKKNTWTNKDIVVIAEALARRDYPGLTQKIEELGKKKQVVQQARLRLALAEHTRDLKQLERARVELTKLGDRQFLRRADEVQQALFREISGTEQFV